MFELLTRKWWVVGLRGLLAVVFGIVALVFPGITLTALVYLFGAYALVDGVFALGTAIGGTEGHRVWFVLEGIAGIAAGILAFAFPQITGTALVYLIAAWAIFTGVFEIAAGFSLPLAKDWLLALAGLSSIVFGVIALLNPGAGAVAIVWLIGLYALVFGGVMLVLAFRLARWHRAASTQTV
jgi:uncharacterized membrane protein HdeD (DUF308 family)